MESVASMKSYPLNIPGITAKSGNNFVFNNDADEETFRHLINDIPFQMKVGFYDKRYPSRSDPGAYVIFMQLNNQYIFQRANHGWSSKWKPISVEKLVKYLSKCSKYNYGTNPFEMMFAYFSVKPPKLQKWK